MTTHPAFVSPYFQRSPSAIQYEHQKDFINSQASNKRAKIQLSYLSTISSLLTIYGF
jgi:hypothetical protein